MIDIKNVTMEDVSDVAQHQQELDCQQMRDDEIEKLIALFVEKVSNDISEVFGISYFDQAKLISIMASRSRLMIRENEFKDIRL